MLARRKNAKNSKFAPIVTKTKGHFLLARKMTTAVTDLQLWLLEAMLSASASNEIEAQQLLRLTELFPFSLTVSVGDVPGYLTRREDLMALASVIAAKREAKHPEEAQAARILFTRIKNERLG